VRQTAGSEISVLVLSYRPRGRSMPARLAAAMRSAEHPSGHTPSAASKQQRRGRVDVPAVTGGHSFMADGLLARRLAVPLLLLGCSADYGMTTEASPRSGPSSVSGSQPGPAQAPRQE
jgi:hypothetical protein